MEYLKEFRSDYQKEIIDKYLSGFEEEILICNDKDMALKFKTSVLDSFNEVCESKLIKKHIDSIINEIINKYFPKDEDR